MTSTAFEAKYGVTAGSDCCNAFEATANAFTVPNFYREYKAEQRKREAAEAQIKVLTMKLDEMRHTAKKLAVKRIFKTGERMTVLWEDGTKTIVKRAEDEPASDYAAFTAALGIKVFGTNSELKRLVATAKEQGRKKNRAERSKDAEHTEGQGN